MAVFHDLSLSVIQSRKGHSEKILHSKIRRTLASRTAGHPQKGECPAGPVTDIEKFPRLGFWTAERRLYFPMVTMTDIGSSRHTERPNDPHSR
jgi:hypothetical protein